MKKKQIAALFYALWLLLVTFFMLQVHLFDLTIFFVLGFIGFLILVELLEPRFVRPGSLRYRNYLLTAGVVIFLGIASQAVTYFLGLTLLQF